MSTSVGSKSEFLKSLFLKIPDGNRPLSVKSNDLIESQ